ncbi:ABC transporter ATP-binding protein [Candidatus Mycoplasma haematohominis]|uniref:ABC transporter ATP-binding protein n=1 Tax=Candidatus Mycoplasma haematohominis TaxID=1494318 RepID=UPI001C0A7150|nr:ABC transporter ATP-binding protein [Candidatus Mycoplasma haemohominis]
MSSPSYIQKNKWLFALSIGIVTQLFLIGLLIAFYFAASFNFEIIKTDSSLSSIEWNFSKYVWRSGEVMSTYGNISRLENYQNQAFPGLLNKLFELDNGVKANGSSNLNASVIPAFRLFNISIQLASAVICLIGILFVFNFSIFCKLVWEYILLSDSFNFQKLTLVILFNVLGFYIASKIEQQEFERTELTWLSNLKWVKQIWNLRHLKHYFNISSSSSDNPDDIILETRGLTFSPYVNRNIFKKLFSSSKEDIERQILKDINLKIKKGSFNVVIGPNGSGKTTLIRSLINLNEGFTGEVLWNGKEISTINRTEFSRQVSYIPQFLNLQNEISILDFLEMFRYPYRQLESNNPDLDHSLVMSTMEKNDCAKWQHKMIKELSGGQKQKILLTSVLVQESEIIVLDEPTSFLDVKNQHQFLEILKEFHRKGKTIIMILHDLQQSIDYADNLIVIQDGEIRASGHPREIVTSRLLRDIFRIDCEVNKTPAGVYLNNIYAL